MIALTTILFLLASAVLAENSCSPDSLQNQHSVEINDMLFALYLKAFEKEYCDDEEYKRRQGYFEETIERIRDSKKELPDTKFWFHHMSDWSVEERQKLHGFLGDKILGNRRFDIKHYAPVGDIPDSWDWREHNLVTEVKDQGKCASYYIFSAVGSIEGQYALKHNSLISLSEQQVLDCDNHGRGCAGGDILGVYDTVIQQGGLEKEEDYPYKGRKGKCSTDESKIAVNLTFFQILFPHDDEENLKSFLYEIGPLSVVMNFNDHLLNYAGGVIDPNCDPKAKPNHAVLLVGYGTEGGKDYWLIKNSWSTKWGEKGYLRMIRGKKQCNILDFVTRGSMDWA